MKLLTAVEVSNHLDKVSDEWKNSDDYWYECSDSYINAPHGWRVNVISSEMCNTEEGTHKCVVSPLEDGIDSSTVIFSLWAKDGVMDYFFESKEDAESYQSDIMEKYSGDFETMNDYAIWILVMNEVRSIMYDWGMDGTFELECDMRDTASNLAKEVLKLQGGE